MPADSGARLRASTATYSASVPLRVQSVNPEDSLADRQPCGAVTQLGNDSGQFVPGNGRAPVAPGAVGPRSRPVKLPWGEARRMHPHDHIVLCRVRVGHFG